jgi:ABC-type uncharacterized transport system substrate-binding protein
VSLPGRTRRTVSLLGISAVLLAIGLLIGPGSSQSQTATRPLRIGVLCAGFCPFPVPPGPSRPLIVALERIGLIQGRTLTWDFGSVVNTEDRLVVEAQHLVSRRPGVILIWPGNTAAARAAKNATRTIPIVLMGVPDAVEHGLVESLRRPGGNISGTTFPLYDLTAKQLQVLKEIDPGLRRLIVIQGDLGSGERQTLDRLQAAAAALGLDGGIRVIADRDLDHAFVAAPPERTSAILAIGSLPIVVHRRIRTIALERKVPFIMPWRPWEAGSNGTLVAYGPHFPAVAERTAVFIDRIVKGARPGDLPVEQPTSYELVIDGVMAKALGLTIPPGVRARADEVLD